LTFRYTVGGNIFVPNFHVPLIRILCDLNGMTFFHRI
jgi:hypothetical protein